MRKLLIAPFDLHERTVALIRRETENAQKGLPARIIAKMNSLVDQQIIEALYQASRAGVKIDLVVRGICCLRPGISDLSANITVRSIVDRFLEHDRVFYFENACQPEIFLSSADWMPRNFFRRIEVAFPVEDGNVRERLASELLAICLADNTKARLLQPNGSYERPRASRKKPRRSQFEFMALAQNHGLKSALPPTSKKTKYPKVKLAPPPARKPSDKR
jgi:polyphosphate kinase